jgi:hypothetical protein
MEVNSLFDVKVRLLHSLFLHGVRLRIYTAYLGLSLS